MQAIDLVNSKYVVCFFRLPFFYVKMPFDISGCISEEAVWVSGKGGRFNT